MRQAHGISRRHFLKSLGLGAVAAISVGRRARGKAGAVRPNVLFIALDDLNDWIQLLDPKAPIRTPNIERLARKGVTFTHAYCASPACNPSRTSILTGLRPSTTGVYGNQTDWRRVLPEVDTIPQHFMRHGYSATGAGKVFHHHYGGAFHDDASFQDFLPMPNPPDAPMPEKKLNGLEWYGSPNTDWGPWPAKEAEAVDVRTADYCINALKGTHEKPFFLAAGIFRPHMPFFAPQRFFDLYKGEVEMPSVKEGDLDDLPSGARKLLKSKEWFFKGMMKAEKEKPGTWAEAVRSYQAAATFADAQVGRILDALEASPYAKNTVVVLWSDHGYHLGEKRHWEKFALWEKTNHVPFIIAAPGVAKAGGRCERAVSLIDLYPTLIELCGLRAKSELDGVSLVPLLKEPQAAWERPALMTYGFKNHAVCDGRYRYICYEDGTEEFYDHASDPHEWDNLVGKGAPEDVVKRLRQWLPEENAAPGPKMKRPT